jgi:hypothetical protein
MPRFQLIGKPDAKKLSIRIKALLSGTSLPRHSQGGDGRQHALVLWTIMEFVKVD